jgi:hypothetical protein
MHCGFSWRTPPCRSVLACTGRLALLACLLVLAFGSTAGPASAYPCERPAKDLRTGSAYAGLENDCKRDRSSGRIKRGNADPMSFMFFIGILGVLGAVVLVPVALGRREDLPPDVASPRE